VPDFFIVGHAKSGTTALYEMLRRHPQIYMPDLKETLFFSLERPRPEPSKTHPDTLEEYLSLFDAARPEQRAGEASPGYLRSPIAAQRIAEVQPDARIIAILREPASFMHSLHLELLQDYEETEKDLRKAIALEQVRRREEELRDVPIRSFRYSPEHVQYVEQLRRYHAVFSPEQVLVLIYEDYRADNEGTLRQVLRFLEVDDTQPIEPAVANPTVRIRSPGLYGLVRSLYKGEGRATGAAKAAIKALTPRGLRRRALAVEQRLQMGKPGEVVRLSEYLDRDLVSFWGYDNVD